MDELLAAYRAPVTQMPVRFTSHAFILALAQAHQAAYATEPANRGADAPFRHLHADLSRALYNYPTLVRHLGEVEDPDIFRQPGRCAEWERI